ncbi:MAG: CO dehydrogenase/acetyl-CoA synthase complex subunit epsilon [Halobacteriota archaeon]|nr:CO dehydrogenase/acetyl-CoA synthase complex subunit epsilon [Halobacteriota archaeon]MDY6959665.1 CO dehydrogenase/acetyl-CoA synthase complex subunit epsilon [Halobacteriota archaeon]
MQPIPFDVGNIPGPEMGRVVEPSVLGNAIASAKRPLLVVGAEILEDGLIDKAIEIGKKGVPIVATGHSIKGFIEKGYDGAIYMGLGELANFLKGSDWAGLDGNGGYDLVAVLGVKYYSCSQMLISLKNFATEPLIRIVSIDRYYHPNARLTFDNISRKNNDIFMKALDEVIARL